MNKFSSTRRRFLLGCGATLTLPFLESFAPTSKATTEKKPPVRTAFFYIPNGVVQSTWNIKNTGREFGLSPTIQPLAPIKEKISIYSNLDRIKVPGTDGHAQAGSCYLSTARPDELSPAGYPLKKTIDQVLADEAGKHTAFRSLELSCNPYQDNRESVYFDNISWYGPSHVAKSIRDPKVVFNRLFQVKEHASHTSVLDIVMDDAKSLSKSIGKEDNNKLGEYLESVRTVEKQLDRIQQRQEQINKLGLKEPAKPWHTMTRSEFINVMGDLMILALQTDLTRVATLMTGPERWGSPLTVDGLFEKPINHHGMTHGQGKDEVREKLQALDRFHIEQFFNLVSKMDNIPEGDGTLLDNMMFVLGSGLSSGEHHVCNNLPTIIAGRAGGRIQPNQHIRFSEGTPIANLWLSMCHVMGVRKERIGDSTQPLSLNT